MNCKNRRKTRQKSCKRKRKSKRKAVTSSQQSTFSKGVTEVDTSKGKLKLTATTFHQPLPSGTGVTEVCANKRKSEIIAVTSTQPLIPGTGATEVGNGKSISFTSGSSSTIKNNVDLDDKLEILLPLFESSDTPLAMSSILQQSDYSDNLLDDEKLSNIQNELLVSSVLHRFATNQLNVFNNFPYELTADNHLIISKPKVDETSPQNSLSEINSCNFVEKELQTEHEFWDFTRSYTDDVHTDSINWLTNKLKSYSDENLFNIPPLGEHYTKNLTKEMLQKQTKILFEQISPDLIKVLNGNDNSVHNASSTRVHEQVMSNLTKHLPKNLNIKEFLEDNDTDKSPKMSNFCRGIYSEQNVKTLLKKSGQSEHSANSLSPPVDTIAFSQTYDDHDEILGELMKCDDMLAEVQESNKKQLTDLLKKCQESYCRKFIKDKLKILDDKIYNFKRQTNRSWTAEEKNAQISKENEEVKSLIQQRRVYLAQLETVTNCRLNVVDLKHTGKIMINDQPSNDKSSDVNAKEPPNKVYVITAPSKYENSNYKIQTKENANFNVEMPVVHKNLDKKIDEKKFKSNQDKSQTNVKTDLRFFKKNRSKKNKMFTSGSETILMQGRSPTLKHLSERKQKCNAQITKEVNVVLTPIIVSNGVITTGFLDQHENKSPSGVNMTSKNNVLRSDKFQKKKFDKNKVVQVVSKDKKGHNKLPINIKSIMKVYNDNKTKEREQCTSAKIKRGRGRPPKSKSLLVEGHRSNTISKNHVQIRMGTPINEVDDFTQGSCYKKVNKSSCVNDITVEKNHKLSLRKKYTNKNTSEKKTIKKGCKKLNQVACEEKNPQDESQINFNPNMSIDNNSTVGKKDEITNVKKPIKKQSQKKSLTSKSGSGIKIKLNAKSRKQITTEQTHAINTIDGVESGCCKPNTGQKLIDKNTLVQNNNDEKCIEYVELTEKRNAQYEFQSYVKVNMVVESNSTFTEVPSNMTVPSFMNQGEESLKPENVIVSHKLNVKCGADLNNSVQNHTLKVNNLLSKFKFDSNFLSMNCVHSVDVSERKSTSFDGWNSDTDSDTEYV